MHRGARNPLRVLALLWARLNAINHHRCDHHAGVCSHDTRDSMPRISAAEANREVHAMIAAALAADDLTRDYL